MVLDVTAVLAVLAVVCVADVVVALVDEGRSVGRGNAVVVACADVTGEPVVGAMVVVASGLHPYNAAVAMIRIFADLNGNRRSTILIIPTSRSDDKSAMDPITVRIACVKCVELHARKILNKTLGMIISEGSNH